MSATQAHGSGDKSKRQVKNVFLGLPEARFYFGCRGHMHLFRRAGYRSYAFPEDAAMAAVLNAREKAKFRASDDAAFRDQVQYSGSAL